MRIANFNIRATPPMRRRRVLEDLRAAKATGAKIINWQELVKLAWYRRWLKKIFPEREGWVHLHLKHRTAISVDTNARLIIRVRHHRLTKGARLLPQPPRYTNEVVTRGRVFDQYDVADLSSHFDNGGYNGRWRPAPIRRARQKRWDRQFAGTRELVHELVDEGLWVVGSGDYNRERMEKFHRDQVWVIQDGIMKLWVVPPAGESVRITDARRISTADLWTDHAGLVASLRRQV